MTHLLTPRGVLHAILRRLPIIWLILVVGLPASVMFALSQPKVYEATAVIQIEAPVVSEQLAGRAVSANVNPELDLIEQKLMSRDSMVRVIEEFELYADDMPMTEKVFELRQAVDIIKLQGEAQSFRPDAQPSGLVINVRLNDPEVTAAVANDFLSAIVQEARSRSAGRAERTLDFIVAEENRVTAQIAEVEDTISDFKSANVDSLPDAIESQRERLTGLIDTRIELDQQLIQIRTQSERIRAEDQANQIALLERQRNLIDDNIATIEAAIAAAPAVERRLSALNRQLRRLNSEYETITASRTDAALSQLLEEQQQSERFEVLETAIVPQQPVTASRRKVAFAGGVATLAAAVGAVVILEMASKKIRTAVQLERQLGVRPVVVIPTLVSRRQRRWRRLSLLAAIAAVLALVWALLRRFGTDMSGALPLQRAGSAIAAKPRVG